MASQSSPGILVQERDFTNSRLQETTTNIGAIAGPFMKGEVGVAKLITNEKELVSTFGKPTADNYEFWFTASEFLNYGGNLQAARISSAVAGNLTNANSNGTTSVNIDNLGDYEANFEGSSQAYKFAAKTPGTWGNALQVVSIDAGADQIITLDAEHDTAPTVGAAIDVGGNTGHVYSISTNGLTIAVVLDAGQSLIAKDDIISGAGAASADLTVQSVTGWYDEQTLAETGSGSGIKWSAIAPRPGTSPYAAARGGANDEIHFAVIDATGGVTGTSNTIIEKILFVSKAPGAKTTEGEGNFFKDVIKGRSNYIYVTAYEDADSGAISGVDMSDAATPASDFNLYGPKSYTLSAGTDYQNYNVGNETQTYLDVFSDTETMLIDYILTGPSSLAKANSLINLSNTRKDCITIVSPQKSDVIGSGAATAATQTANVVDFFESISDSSSYAVFANNYKYIYDRFNDSYRWIPCDADVAGLCVNASETAEAWFSPAGFNRGNLRNAIKIAYNPNQAQRDELYGKRVNPIVSFPGQGIVLYGDKTALRSPSAFDRVNVRRLFLILERTIKDFSKSVLFELNDVTTRNNFATQVNNYMRDIQSRRGMTDFLVVADESNNTPDVIDRNEFVADIYIKPSRSINYITLTFVATRTGVSFDEVVGRV
jgi:hypothetical protein